MLEGKVAVVTGAGRGLGQGIAEFLALSRGCKVVVNDYAAETAEQVTAGIVKQNGKAVCHSGDISDRACVEAMLKTTLDAFGSIDIVVNNAGIVYVKHFLDVQDSEWDHTIKVNLRGTFLCCQVFGKYMVDNGIKGRIVNMSSKSGKQGGLWLGAYCATKAGIIGFTQSLAMDLASSGITVNAVCPGIIFTPRWDQHNFDYGRKLNIPPDQVRDYYIKKIPLGRPGTNEDVAKVVAFLCSDDASYMTGQAINVTGGQEMR